MGQIRVRGVNVHGTYATASVVAGLFAFFGWALVVIGVLIVVIGLSAGAPFNIMAGGTGIAIAAIGLLQVAAEQILKATVDMADYARQSLLLQIAVAEGREQVDLGTPDGGASVGGPISDPELPRTGGAAGPAPQTLSDMSKDLSEEAISVLRRAREKGYQVRFAPDKRSIILAMGGWQTSLSSEAEILKFGQDMR